MINPEEVTVSLYDRVGEFKDFQCEKQGYRDFVQKTDEAKKYYDDNFGVTYVFKLKRTRQPIGFVTLAMSALPRKQLPPDQEKQKPFSNVPSLLLGHMARDRRFKGEGVGQIIIDWVKLQAYELGKKVGCRFVIIDSEPDKVSMYQTRYDFVLIPADGDSKHALMYYDLGKKQQVST